MFQRLLTRRQNVSGIIFCLYFFPILLVVAYTVQLFSEERSWTGLSIGLLLSALGTLTLYTLLNEWQESARRHARLLASAQAMREYQEEEREDFPLMTDAPNPLIDVVDQLRKEIETLKNQAAEQIQENQDLLDEYQQFKASIEDDLEGQKGLSHEYQETISEQRSVIEKKQAMIEELENKLKERDYELKTLLQLSDIGGDSHQETEVIEEEELGEEELKKQEEASASNRETVSADDASKLLKRCIDSAQKITGASHFSRDTPLFRDFQVNNYALDLRRLFDTLQSETASVVIVFSPKENRVLFTNQVIKNWLGWNADKFSQDFFYLIEEGMDEWKSAVSPPDHEEHRIRLLLKTRSGNSQMIHCHMKAIPTGIFRGHVIGVFHG